MLLFTDTKCLQLGCFYVFPFQISLEKLGSNMIQNQPELLAIGRPGSLGPAPQDTLQIIKVLFKIRECWKINNIICLKFCYNIENCFQLHLKPSRFTPNKVCSAAGGTALPSTALCRWLGQEVGCGRTSLQAGGFSYSDWRCFFLLWFSIALLSASSWRRSDSLTSVWLQPILGQLWRIRKSS